MEKKVVGIAAMLGIIFVSMTSMAYADDWAIDSDEAIVIVQIDSDGLVQFQDAFVGEHEVPLENVVIDRPTETGGKVLATTTSGYTAYIIYDLEAETIKAKIWTNSGVERVVVSGEKFYLF